jgi:hypothetical protein
VAFSHFHNYFNLALRDASVAQIAFENIASPSDVDDDDLKRRIVNEINRIAGAVNIFTVCRTFLSTRFRRARARPLSPSASSPMKLWRAAMPPIL